jgi:hypothetical protein
LGNDAAVAEIQSFANRHRRGEELVDRVRTLRIAAIAFAPERHATAIPLGQPFDVHQP